MRRFIPLVLVWLPVLALVSSHLPAQNPAPRYYPQRPTLSPYLNYFIGANPGVIDRYNAYVRPAQQLQQTLGSQDLRVRQLGGDVQEIRQSGVSPTGIGASFGNYSHYYPGARGGRR